MNKYVNPPSFNWLAISYSISHVIHYYQLWVNPRKRRGSHPPLVGVLPVTRQNWRLMRVFPRAALSRICKRSPIRMWSSKKERSAWGQCWRRSRQAIVELKKPLKEIASLKSWAVWTKRLGVNQRDSHLLTFCDVQIRCQNRIGGCGRCSWFAIVLFVILHIPLATFEE